MQELSEATFFNPRKKDNIFHIIDQIKVSNLCWKSHLKLRLQSLQAKVFTLTKGVVNAMN